MTCSIWSKTVVPLMDHVMIAPQLRTSWKDWCLAMQRWCVSLTILCKSHSLYCRLEERTGVKVCSVPSVGYKLMYQERIRFNEHLCFHCSHQCFDIASYRWYISLTVIETLSKIINLAVSLMKTEIILRMIN